MQIEQDEVSLTNKIPRITNCSFCVSVKNGAKLIAVLGILIGLSCLIVATVQTRKCLTVVESFLLLFLTLFVLVTVAFLILSALLLLAAVDENPVLLSYYIWLAIVYMSVQLVLAIAIPVLLALAGKYHFWPAMVWLAIIVVICLGWTHFVSLVSKYRVNLLWGA
ncbi:hypothetical protein ABMA27_001394 [Loxostege sticticalis]|uniref:MARVEL domain-containing protein n=1 Tax=Loxostege sticticalis TaxID=481309 RepID=A0ABR3HYD4_LOXSC